MREICRTFQIIPRGRRYPSRRSVYTVRCLDCRYEETEIMTKAQAKKVGNAHLRDRRR